MKINKVEKIRHHNLIAVSTPQSYEAEQFRNLRTSINFQTKKQKLNSIVITSPSYSEGKTMTAANLAVVYAEEGKEVLLIDGDMRKPTIHEVFDLQNFHGLSNVLAQQIPIEKAITSSGIRNLKILTGGPVPVNPVELLASHTLEDLIASLISSYDLVIFDSPPLLFVSDAQILADKCQYSILILNSQETEKRLAQKAKSILDISESRLIGAVLNNYRIPMNK